MDRNSDFQEAFKAECGWIQIVYDHFHIVKNFNDKVIAEVRKDEQTRLKKEGPADEYSGRLSPVFRGPEPLSCSSLNRRFQIDRATYPMLRA